MSEPVITEVSGLQLSNNTFSASPPGSLSIADNGVISQKGVFQPRNGQAWASTMPAANQLPFALVEFQQRILTQYGTSKTDVAQKLGYVNAGAITPYASTFNPVGDNGAAIDYARMHFTLAALFLHFCASTGPYTLETYSGTPRRSGLSRVPDIEAGQLQVPAGTQAGVVPYNSSVAYRYAHKRITSTGQVLISPPSNRFVVTNRFLIPVGGLVRTGGNLVTITVTPAQIWAVLGFALPFTIGNTVNISPGEANFVAGAKVLTGNPTTNTVTYAEAGANVASTVAQEVNPGPLASKIYIRLSADAVAGDIIQLFKSVATSASNIEPSADVYLCAEHLVTAGEVAAGSFTITDYTPQSVLRVPLYTNPSDGDGQGELGANFAPPLYLDSSNWDSRTFYLAPTGQQYLDLQMLGVGGPDGIQDGDTLTIFDGVATTKVFTFKNAPAVFTDIPIISDGLPSYNIAWTTFFLAVRVNFATQSLGIMATGATSPSGFPGAFRIERTDYKQTAFQVKASRPASWSPALQAAVYTNSFGNSQPNGLVWGKAAQPESVPVTNSSPVGVSNYYGRRVFGLRNSLIILKEGDGIWSLSGSGGNYSPQQLSTANIVAPDCACVFSDCVWAYTDQGILRISDTGGVQTISRQIETELNRLATAFPTETYAWSFAVPYETERRIMFFVPFAAATAGQGGAPLMKAWVYSAATNAWTGPLIFNGNPVSGIVTTGHQLWTGIYDQVFLQGRLTQERKTNSYLDLADGQWANTLTFDSSVSLFVVTLATAGAIQQGTGISQTIGGATYYTKVTAVLGGGRYQVAEVVPWVSGAACTIYDPFPVEVQFLPEGSPGSRKALARLFTLYKPQAFANLFGLTTLQTDQIQSALTVSTPFNGYGLTPYGQGSYGNPSPMVVDTNPIDSKWANAGQFFPGFRLNEVWCAFKLQGLGMQLEGASAPVGRGK